MVAKLWKEGLLLVLGVAGLWYFFTKVDVIPDVDVLELSVEQEERLGEDLYEMVAKAYPAVKDSVVLQALDEIADRLIDNVGPTDYTFKVHVVENSQINAFATLGGHIFVFTGLIEFTESPEELAAVLAHEIGHVQERHVVTRMATELGSAIVLAILAGDSGLAGELYDTILSGVFSRSQERDADEFSLALMDESGLSPTAMATFFRRMNRELGSLDQNLEFLQTHPHNNSRIKAALEYEVSEDFVERPFNMNWEEVRETLQ